MEVDLTCCIHTYDSITLTELKIICQVLDRPLEASNISCEWEIVYIETFLSQMLEKDSVKLCIVGQNMHTRRHAVECQEAVAEFVPGLIFCHDQTLASQAELQKNLRDSRDRS